MLEEQSPEQPGDEALRAEADYCEEQQRRVDESKSAALIVAPKTQSAPVPTTAAQAKIDAIAALTNTAYARASELKLTAEESAALQADFPDEAFRTGAAGKENLIYLEHAVLRERLNQVLGLGQWAVIPRARWAEDFDYWDKESRIYQKASRVYVEAMFLVRGCFVTETIGDQVYYPKNQSMNYGDAVEAATSEALRRCAKAFGVGLQAWRKDFQEGWWQRRRAQQKSPATASQAQSRHQAPAAAPAPARTDPGAKAPDPSARRDRMIKLIDQELGADGSSLAWEFFEAIGAILPVEGLEDVPISFVPASHEQMAALLKAIDEFAAGAEARLPYPKNPTPAPAGKKSAKPQADSQEEEAWRSFPMPWGANAGIRLGDLDKKYLFGLWANYTVETEYKGKPKKPETIAKDREFRAMLDLAGKHYEFKK